MIAVAVLAAWAGLIGPLPASTAGESPQRRAGACSLALNGQDVGAFAEPDNAWRLDVHDVVQIEASVSQPTSATEILLDMPIGPSIPMRTIEHEAATQTSDSLRIADISDFGVGWYHVEVRSGSCDVSFWVIVSGRSPLTTIVGLVAAALMVLGLGLLVSTVLRARRRGRATWGLGVLGGLLVGVGVCLFAQQFAIVAFTVGAMLSFLGGGAALGAGATAAGGASGGATATVGVGSPPSIAPPPSAPPPSAPPPSAPPPLPTAVPPTPPPPPTPVAPSPVSPPTPVPPPPSPSNAPPPHPVHGEPPPFTHAEPPGSEEPLPAPAASGAAPETDPPRQAFARIECDDAVVIDSEFQVIVGLAAQPVHGVVGPALVRPPSSVGDYELTVQLLADGFQLSPGEVGRKTMMVTAVVPYPFVVFRLRAPVSADPDHPYAINAIFSVDSQTMGLGTRYVRLVGSIAALGDRTATLPPPAVGVLAVPTAQEAPDLTVRILSGNESGHLMWSFESPHVALTETAQSSIGGEPEAFARTVIATMAAHEGRPTLALGLHGIGLTIGAHVPAEMWSALAAVADAVAPRRPTVLLLSDEAYVPWELSAMPTPLDDSCAAVLGAQVVIGRWVLATHRPSLPPPRLVHVEGMLVISGRYEQPGWSRLEHAEAEAASLVERYHAVGVDAVTADVAECLIGHPPGDVLHFSLHGKYDPGSAKQGLVLVDGGVIDPLVVKGGTLPHAPLVFLNACQVGMGQETLGDYAGLAESFLYAGASAVVAPLWSIDDSIASALAERFYERAFAGESVAEIIRSERAACGSGDHANSSTLMAFQFFGHPAMHLER